MVYFRGNMFGYIKGLVYQNGSYLFTVWALDSVQSLAECDTGSMKEARQFAKEILTQY